MENHCIYHVHCCSERVKDDFIERWKSNHCNEKEDLYDIYFWYHQKEFHLKHLPNHAGVFNLGDEVEEYRM